MCSAGFGGDTAPMKRRTYLTTATVTAAIGIAGCTGDSIPIDGETDLDEETEDGDADGDDTGDSAGEANDTDGGDNETEAETETNDSDDFDEETEEEETNETAEANETEEAEEANDTNQTEEDGNETNETEETTAPGQPERGATFDDFEDLDAWEVVAGTLEADADRASTGSQSARLTASESEDRVRIRRELSDPINVEELVPGLALSTSSSASPIIQLYDEDGNYLQFQQYIHEGRPFIRHDFGHTQISGEPDLSAITEIQIGYWTGEGYAGEIWVDDLHFTGRIEDGRVMIQFQGGYESDYTHAFPIMEDHGLTATTFVATARIRDHEEVTGSRMTEDQLSELVDAGWSLGTVGTRGRHLNRVEGDEVESHILDPLEWFDEHGYEDAQYFGFPGGWYTEEMYDLVAENYDIAWGGRHRCQGMATNPYNLTRISGHEGQRNLDAEEMIGALDWAADHGGLTTIVFYEMDEGDAAALEETAAHLAELVSAGDLELITPREIADDYVL